MTGLARRDLFKLAAVAGIVALPAGVEMARHRAPVVVYDSRIREARGFVGVLKGAAGIDLAHADATRWAAIRADLPRSRPVEGLTRWSDWVSVRGELEAQGLRLAHETILGREGSNRSSLVRWGMVPRAGHRSAGGGQRGAL